MSDPVLWDVKFLDCCLAGPICLLACICPAVVQSLSFYKKEKSACGNCLLAQICCCLGLSLNRGKIREFNKEKAIAGSICLDCLLYSCFCCCCHACLATQEYRQVSMLESSISK